MRFTIATVALLSVGYAAAATCPDQTVIDACISSTKAGLSTCADTDKDCVCTAWTSVVACYNNCPENVDLAPAQTQQAANCGKASNPKSAKAAATTPVIGLISSAVSSSLASVESSLAGELSSVSSSLAAKTTAAASASASESAAATSASASGSSASASASASGSSASATAGSASSSASASASPTGAAGKMVPEAGSILAFIGAGLALVL